MEEYEEQELEFWRKLEEADMSRSQMLKRSVAAAAGLTVLASPATALGALRRLSATPPLKGKSVSMKELVAEAKKEGKLNTIALPHDWANYGNIISTFKKKYGLTLDEQNPNGTSAQENEAVRSLKGDSRAPDVVDDGPPFAISGTAQGLFAKYFNTNFGTIPRFMKDTRGYCVVVFYGAISNGYYGGLVRTPPKSFAVLL
jgi:putative spermidine/putrescine transport system substrate-binding protein